MRLLRDLKLDEVFVLDIETVPCVGQHNDLHDMLKELWEHKCHALRREKGWISHHDHIAPLPDTLHAAALFEQAGIYAEFGRVVCISVGRFRYTPAGELRFSVKSFYGHDEKQLLREFSEVISHRPHFRLCGHNAKEFDLPYISRRLLINGLELPPHLDTAGKKPWEIPHLDTMELWKFGDRKSFTSLSLLAAMFGIPTPKDDIQGKDVARVYYEENDLPRIARYCQKDIITTARLLLKFRGDEPFGDEAVQYADEATVMIRRA